MSSKPTALVQSARAQAWSSLAPMNITDYYVIAAVVISAVVGCFRGFLREAIALVTWIIALFIGWHFSESIAPNLGGTRNPGGPHPVAGGRHWRDSGALCATIHFQRHGPLSGIHFRRLPGLCA